MNGNRGWHKSQRCKGANNREDRTAPSGEEKPKNPGTKAVPGAPAYI
jgi:hypothetical protein